MLRLLPVSAALLSICRVAAARSGKDASLEDDSAWSEEHTVKERPAPRARPLQRKSWSGDRLAILGHLGVGAPAGALGVDVDIAPVSFLAVDLGAGLSPNGWQLAATPRFRIRLSPTAFITLGGGLSVGPYDNSHSLAGLACAFFCIAEGMGDSSGRIAQQHYDRARWYNLELGWDIYARKGNGMLRLMLGYSQILNNNAYSCAQDPNEYYAPHNGCDRTSGQGLAFAAFAGGVDL